MALVLPSPGWSNRCRPCVYKNERLPCPKYNESDLERGQRLRTLSSCARLQPVIMGWLRYLSAQHLPPLRLLPRGPDAPQPSPSSFLHSFWQRGYQCTVLPIALTDHFAQVCYIICEIESWVSPPLCSHLTSPTPLSHPHHPCLKGHFSLELDAFSKPHSFAVFLSVRASHPPTPNANKIRNCLFLLQIYTYSIPSYSGQWSFTNFQFGVWSFIRRQDGILISKYVKFHSKDKVVMI